MGFTERRSNERKKVTGAVVALMHDDLPEIAPVGEVSCTGLSFLYNGSRTEFSGKLIMDILFLPQDVFWPRVPCLVISDIIPPAPPESYRKQKRRLGVKFDRLTHDQESWLKNFVTARADLVRLGTAR